MPVDSSPNDDISRVVRQHLESLQGAGVKQLPRPIESAATVARRPTDRDSLVIETRKDQPVASQTELLADGESSDAATLDVLQTEVASCTLCNELAVTRKQTVFGTGDCKARLCMLGEAPGADEDRQGEPFVGRSGQLLTKILAACSLQRSDVYILNILKCRPPGNRNPTTEESNNCRRFLNRQLQLIDPEFICCLGAVAAHNLLDTTTPLGRLRGKLHDYRGIKVLCTYHPAYLLRNPGAKKDAWEDMKLLMREMGTPVK